MVVMTRVCYVVGKERLIYLDLGFSPVFSSSLD